MPLMVPDNFASDVSMQPTQTPRQSGPFVQPMDNHAPAMEQQLGATTEQAGLGLMQEGETIGNRIRDQLNDTAVKNAETQLLGSINNTLHGPQGYMNSRGQNAVNGYDAAAQAIAKARQDAAGTLTNPLQQRIFGQAADRHLMVYGTEMNDHRFQQVAGMSAQAAQDRMQAHIPFAVNARSAWQQVDDDGNATGNFAAHLSVIQQEAQNKANLLYGVQPDSDIAQGMVRDATTQVAQGVVNGFLADHDFSSAKSFFDDWNSKGMIDERAAQQLEGVIKSNTDRETVKADGDQHVLDFLQQKQGTPAAPVRVYPMPGLTISQQYANPEPNGKPHDGVDIAAPVGTRVLSPEDGTVEKVWNDDQFGGGTSMLVKLASGYTAGFAHLSATNYKPGDQVTQGQPIALSGNSGTNTTGPHLHYTLTDPDGNKVDPMAAPQSTPEQKAATLDDFTDPKDLQDVLAKVRADQTDPVLQTETVNYVESLYRKARIQKEQIASDNWRDAQNQWYAAGGDPMKIDPEVYGALDPEQKYQLSQGIPKKNDFDTLAGFILNPSTLTTQNVEAARTKLTDETTLHLLAEAQDMQGDPEKVYNATMEMDRLKYFANQAGMPNIYGTQTPDQKQQFATLAFSVQGQIAAEQAAKKRMLTPQEKDTIMQGELTKQTLHQLRSPNNPLVVLGFEDKLGTVEAPYRFTLPVDSSGQIMPDKVGREYVIQRLNAAGINNPTDEQIGAYYREALKH